MAGNSFGTLFRITTFGESHGPGIGVVIDGCPAGLQLDLDSIQTELERRRPGQSAIVTQRNEVDRFEILSGTVENSTTGAPLTFWIANTNQKPADYDHLKTTFRPSHADYTYHTKYGTRDIRGGGRSSARTTAACVAAGAVAKQLLGRQNISIQAYVSQVGNIVLSKNYQELDLSAAETNAVRCPDPAIAAEMEALIRTVRKDGDTIGGVVQCVIQNCPAGLGAPVFEKLHAGLAHAMLGINACKGFEYGSGFGAVAMRGSEHNDVFFQDGATTRTHTNHSGGIQGGISNGMDIYFRCAFKPVSTLMRDQTSVDSTGNPVTLSGKGRHDPCVVPRAVPIVEAMAALVLADHYLQDQAVRLQA